MQISEEQRQKIKELAAQYHLRLVLLFGSQATGCTHPKSDVDIAVLAERSLDELRIRYTLDEELRKIFHRADVELVDLRHAPPLLQRDAAMEGVVLFEEQEGFFDKFQMFAVQHFVETKPLRDMIHERLQEFIAT